MRAIFILLAAALPAAAAELTYDACLDHAGRDPHAAQAAAIAWFERTGDPAAAHCEAVALTEQGALASAANRLQETAAMPGLPATARAELLAQAAALWRGLGEDAAALEALDAAVAQTSTATLHMERAAVFATLGDGPGARKALDAALALKPGDAEVMAASAAERMRVGDAIGAQLEAEAALAAAPDSIPALLTLGRAQRALGLRAEARRAWLRVIERDGDGVAAQTARGLLQEMDGG